MVGKKKSRIFAFKAEGKRRMIPMISIIIPIYNASNYLKRCLDSVLGQSYKNWECILVDDGSIDNSGEICEEYKNKDSRFKLIHKANQGVSSARNVGINLSGGDWLFFCDSDDELLPNGLEILINASTEYSSEIIFGGYIECDEDGSIIASPKTEMFKRLSKTDTILQLYQPSNSNYEGYLWCKLFLADIVKSNHISFHEDIFFNEDRLFIMECLSYVNHDIAYSSIPVYQYYRHTKSAYGSLQKQWNPCYITDLRAYVKMYEVVCNITEDKHIRFVAKVGIRSSIRNIRKMLKHQQIKDSLVKRELEETRRSYWGKKEKLMFFLIRRKKEINSFKDSLRSFSSCL